MTKFNKILIGVLGTIVVIGLVLSVLDFIKEMQNAQDSSSLPSEAVSAFQETLVDRTLTRGAQPIEGFQAFMFLEVFPGLQERDFDGVVTGAGRKEGMHTYTNGELLWKRIAGQPITTAQKAILPEGYATLLKNLSQRLDMPASTAEEAIAIIDEIDIPSDVNDHIISKRDKIRVYGPKPLSVITSPLTVWGEARGSWFFEGDFQVTLVDWDGRIIAESYATTKGDWMTKEFVPFKGTVEFENPSNEANFSKRGALIFQKANPSGLPENADALEIPVLFEEQ
jgi:hypothetical protein